MAIGTSHKKTLVHLNGAENHLLHHSYRDALGICQRRLTRLATNTSMIDIEHEGPYIDASVLLTLSVVQDQTAFCTIEYLTPIKFNVSNTCYTGPITQENLVLLTCPKSQHVLTTESLTKYYQDSFAFICPTNVLNVATNITWLGFPYNPDTKLTFPRNHVPTNDCANLHPLLHLGGRMFLSIVYYNKHTTVIFWTPSGHDSSCCVSISVQRHI